MVPLGRFSRGIPPPKTSFVSGTLVESINCYFLIQSCKTSPILCCFSLLISHVSFSVFPFRIFPSYYIFLRQKHGFFVELAISDTISEENHKKLWAAANLQQIYRNLASTCNVYHNQLQHTSQQTFQNTVRSCKMGEILRVKCRPGKAHIFNHDADVDQRKHISKFILAVA